jgi:DNA repair protein RecO (recombination protein O)
METWQDEGFILSVRAHGETSAILTCMTPTHGRFAGLVRGGQSKRLAPVLQVGNQLALRWGARLSENLGRFDVELEQARAALVLGDAARLTALQAFCNVLQQVLPERDPLPAIYHAGVAWLDLLATPHWAEGLVSFELGLLQALGFGLDLSCCAATGQTDDLIYVSPRSGRAVSAEAGEPYKERLLLLPEFLRGGSAEPGQARQGLKLTGHFLEKHLCHANNRPLPDARLRLMDHFPASDLASAEEAR